MARPRRGPIKTPPWLAGPILAVTPVLIAMFVAVAPRPVPPHRAVPRLDRVEADRQLQTLLARERGAELDESQRGLLRLWEAHARLRVFHARTEGQAAAVAAAQRSLALECRDQIDDRGAGGVLVVGDVIAARLVRALMLLETRGPAAEADAQAHGGTFLRYARTAGLVDGRGRLAAHPLVVAVAAKAGFRAECSLEPDTAFEPVEGAAMDVLRIRFGTGLPVAVRAAAAERFRQHDPSYPAVETSAALYFAAGDGRVAYTMLRDAALAAPGDRALRNHFLYAAERLEQEQ